MSWKKEPCRNFQRGSCRYGDRCKFLHVTHPPSKPNPFGFGTGSTPQSLNTNQQNKVQQQPSPFGFGSGSSNHQQKQQQQPNPFGFGVQSGHHIKGASPFGASHRSSYQQPFENKWIRTVNSSPTEQIDSQPRAVYHKCEDPNVCKQLIAEDLTNERPLWKLTCYGHFKGLPCDISGDTSYEELRAVAYDDARLGLSLESIVERERNLLNSKLLEFDKLLRSPYVISQTHTTAGSTFSNQNMPPINGQNDMAFQAFSFGQPRPSPVLSGISIGQPSPFQDLSQIANGNEMRYESSGSFVGQLPKQPFGGTSGPNVGFAATQNRSLSALSGSSFGLTSAGALENIGELETIDAVIWLKNKWRVKEIPEEEPPSRFCFDQSE